jgi:hypothetical protein
LSSSPEECAAGGRKKERKKVADEEKKRAANNFLELQRKVISKLSVLGKSYLITRRESCI